MRFSSCGNVVKLRMIEGQARNRELTKDIGYLYIYRTFAVRDIVIVVILWMRVGLSTPDVGSFSL